MEPAEVDVKCRSVWPIVLTVIVIGASARSEELRDLPYTLPADRLIRNLEQMISAEPKNASLRINLARTHAMAAVTGAENIQVKKDREQDGPAFALQTPYVPYSPLAGDVRPLTDKARKHLADAIASYEAALSLEPRNAVARLGLGWCQMTTGQNARAIESFRAVVADAWKSEQSVEAITDLRGSMTSEVASYLIPLLHPERDAAEIGTLRGYQAQLAKKPRFMSPVVVQLHPGVVGVADVVDHRASVFFDADGRATGDRWSWITPAAGWLMFDSVEGGEISSALQLFGNVTFWMFWSNGYEAMRALDDNQDGTLAGDELKGLAIWRDANSNGVSEQDEVKPVADWGIVALSTRYVAEDESDVYVAASPTGVTFRDGTTRPTWDVLLHRNRSGQTVTSSSSAAELGQR